MPHFEIYQAHDGYRWRLWSANGRIVAESGEAYTTHAGASQGISLVKALAPTAPVR